MTHTSAVGSLWRIVSAIALLVTNGGALSGSRGETGQPAILLDALQFVEPLWDDRCALVWHPSSKENPAPPQYSVRGTAWFAVGLLMRDGPGDRDRAVRAIEAVLAEQIDAPGEPWDGTFFRAPDEPHPPLFAREWDDFDPNWRQFIGTTWAVLLLEYSDHLPAGLAPRLEESIRRAIEGERGHGRLKPEYTNIALMHAFLWGFAGERLKRPEWIAQAEEYAAAIHELFKPHGTFDEYNSPTYYGVDLYGLALWRKHGATPRIRELGALMEAELWRDIARFYHAGMRNMCGPFDRGYGMDMTHYVALAGMWMGLALDRSEAPLPVFDENMEHAHDLGTLPLYVTLGARIPADAMEHFRAFQGERVVERIITPQRTATAWLGHDVMIGGEITRRSRAAGTPWSQFYPATIHWRAPGGGVGWVLLKKCPRVDARAGPNQLTIQAIGDSTFRVSVPGLTESSITAAAWKLPGLSIRVEHDATGFSVVPGPFFAEVHYRGATRLDLRTEFVAAP